jgi:hypothetical protein
MLSNGFFFLKKIGDVSVIFSHKKKESFVNELMIEIND